ncbi:hypothetical protein DM02DRAFT_626076 [Periconia macrospinosa]|uniref:Uncharacterized protein n=1 Tax=Periconia macrospinosa TaxID=97972 RepID=A0A2V1DYC2_9PLEO|nr:hypothetical protein DM02DRAFT_626076 [Periconia macrospinosa]
MASTNPTMSNERLPTPTLLTLQQQFDPTLRYTTLATLETYVYIREASRLSILPPVTAHTFEPLSEVQIAQIGHINRHFVVPVRLLLGHFHEPQIHPHNHHYGHGGVSILTPTPPSRLNAMNSDFSNYFTNSTNDNNNNEPTTTSTPVYAYLVTRTPSDPISKTALLLGSRVSSPQMTAASLPHITFAPPFDRLARAYANPEHAVKAISVMVAYYFVEGRHVDGFWTRSEFGMVFGRVIRRLAGEGLLSERSAREFWGDRGGEGVGVRDEEDATTLVGDEESANGGGVYVDEGYHSGRGTRRRGGGSGEEEDSQDEPRESLRVPEELRRAYRERVRMVGEMQDRAESVQRRLRELFASSSRVDDEDDDDDDEGSSWGSSRDFQFEETSTSYAQDTPSTRQGGKVPISLSLPLSIPSIHHKKKEFTNETST